MQKPFKCARREIFPVSYVLGGIDSNIIRMVNRPTLSNGEISKSDGYLTGAIQSHN